MRSKILLSTLISFMVLFLILLVPTKALYPQPRVDLDEYAINVTSNTDVYVEGSVSKAYGQQISIRDTSFTPIALGEVGNSGGKESFRIKIPAAYIKSGSNIFYVYSEVVRGKLARSNSKEFKVNYNSEKQNQTIIASNKSVTVGKTISLGAKSSSGLPLSYKSDNPSIATIDSSGKVVGRKVGSTKIIISQDGNNQYSSVTKTVKVTVNKVKSSKKSQRITVSSKSIYVGKTALLGAKVTSKRKLTYNSSNTKIATINSKGKITGKKAGKVVITIKQAGNSEYKAVTKKVTITVKNIDRKKASGMLAEGASPSAGIVINNYRNSWRYVLRANDSQVANDISKYAKIIAKNNKVGYSQANNVGPRLYKNLLKKGPYKCRGKASCCPFALVSAKYSFKQNGKNVAINTNVRSSNLLRHIRKINKSYTSKGKQAPFKIIKMSDTKLSKKNYKKYLYAGDILLKKNQKHTAVLL